MRNQSSIRRFIATGLSLLLVVLLAQTMMLAQQSTAVTGGLNGVVTDGTGAVVPNATVSLTGPQGTVVVKTDNTGRYTASGLTPGYYDVSVSMPGFSKITSKHNEVDVNLSSTLNMALKAGAGEVVQVSTNSASAMDTQSTAITTHLTDTFYNSIPMPRNVSNIFYVAPGVVQGQINGAPNQVGPGTANPSIGGSTGLENLYVVDGVTITDQAFGSIGTYNRYKGALGTGINLAFIKEVDVKTTAFEPQYGKATGGIVLIVTKSGSRDFHGAIGTYFAPGKFYATAKQYYQFGYQQTAPSQTLNRPQYDISFELGGYVPHFRNNLFFFGAFDPSLSQATVAANPIAPAQSVALGAFQISATASSNSAKLTYKLGDRTNFEGATFADPSRRNAAPNTLSTSNPGSATSFYHYGSRDSFFRADTAITPSWQVDASYTYNFNHFQEQPTVNNYLISNQAGQSLVAPTPTVSTGFGPSEPSKNDTYSIAANMQKTFHFFANHTVSIGYAYDHTNFLDSPTRSGPLFAIPTANANGTPLRNTGSNGGLFTNIPAGTVGALTNGQFTVAAANSAAVGNPGETSTTDTTCTQCPTNAAGEKIYASISRGTYVGFNVQAKARYHVGYGNDVIELNRFATIDAGLRWEQGSTGGDLLNYVFTGNWSPRVGINIDPLGDHKGKVFFNYGRNYWAMPLDAAIRQLGNEQDDTSYYFAPVINSDQSISLILDNAHVLNGLPKKTVGGVVTNFGAPSFSSSTGEGILPGTKAEYEDEYVLGVEREVKSFVVKARYTDRRLGRIVEDIGSQSPEGSTMTGNFVGGISNPTPSTDIAVNEQEVTYTPAQFTAANPASKGTLNAGNYSAPVAGCTFTNDTYTQGVGGFFINGQNQAVGGACFTNLATMDGPFSATSNGDGISDGFVKPVRRYQALELELDKRFSNHWMAQINYRFGKLYGNYEGAYRNDNGQSDPGISSLFDFTAGKLGLLGNQFQNGFLSSDRRNVGNLFMSYNIGGDTPYVHMLKGLTAGFGLRGQSGVPLSLLGDHPIYLNQGEVPIGGRGAAGRTPTSVQLDLHGDYTVPTGSHLSDRYKIKVVLDAFNVTNSQFITAKVQYSQNAASGVGVAPNLDTDYGRPTNFQTPFYARGSVRFEF